MSLHAQPILRPGDDRPAPVGLASPEIELEVRQMEREIAVMQRLLDTRARHAALRAELAAAGLAYEAVVAEARTMPDVATAIAAHFGLTLEDMTGPAQFRSVARPRWVVMAALHARRFADGRQRYSKVQIGRFLGGRDHTTVIHGLRQFWNLVDADLRAAGWRACA